MNQSTMRAAALDAFGGIDVITLQTLPVPAIDRDEVLIQVEIASVGSWDKTERQGGYEGAFGMPSTFPYILGWEGAGRVAAIGEDVTGFAVGDRVYAASMPLPKGGFYAEYAAVPAEHVAHIPPQVTIEQAGVMAWDALTALSGLDALQLKKGETLMIFGASGGIGHMAVQFAKRLGVRVLAVASGEQGIALTQSLGADLNIDGRKQDVAQAAQGFAPVGLDAALTLVGGEVAGHALAAVRPGGRIAYPNGVLPVPHGPAGVHMIAYNGDRSRQALKRLNALIASGPFTVHVAKTFPLDHVREAHEMLDTHYVGKIALRVHDGS